MILHMSKTTKYRFVLVQRNQKHQLQAKTMFAHQKTNNKQRFWHKIRMENWFFSDSFRFKLVFVANAALNVSDDVVACTNTTQTSLPRQTSTPTATIKILNLEITQQCSIAYIKLFCSELFHMCHFFKANHRRCVRIVDILQLKQRIQKF